MPAVTFDYALWTARYPEFSGVQKPLAQLYFDEAGLYLANEESNPCFSAGILPTLLNMVTAHIAALNSIRNGQDPSPLVGRISSASEGSVNVSVEWKGSGSPSEEWWTQTKYGAAFWQATASYRQMRYFANPTVVWGGISPLVSSFRGR